MGPGLGAEGVAVGPDAVMHHPRPVRGRDPRLLRGGDRRDRQVREAREEQGPVEFVHPPVDGGEAVAPPLAEQRRMGEFAVAMDDIERVEAQAKGFQLQGIQRRRHPRRDLSEPAFQRMEARLRTNKR